MAKDETYISLINTVRWRKLRRSQLSLRPLCEMCAKQGRTRSATEVHHIRPVQEGASYIEKEHLAYDPGNLLSLCHECHVSIHRQMHKGSRATAKARDENEVKEAIRMLFTPSSDPPPPGGIFKRPTPGLNPASLPLAR